MGLRGGSMRERGKTAQLVVALAAGVAMFAPVAALAQVTVVDNIFNNSFEAPCSEDADRDGLPDCVETNTGVYAGSTDSGTDPHNPDTDGDGLLDGEEVFGTAGGLDLPGLGVNPLHKDILVEYDWFDDAVGCAQHSHRPTSDVIQGVHDFFANAPVANPDGTTGINLVQDYGQGGVFTGGNLVSGNSELYGTVFGTDYQNDMTGNFATNRRGYFHYVLMVHTYDDTTGNTGSSGYAAIPGDELMISMACTVTTPTGALFIRNAIAHELGHNFGLQHGGDEACNYKPNYSSIMNYAYEFLGVDTTCKGTGDPSGSAALDYSHGDRATLSENGLDEQLGMCTTATVPVDWNMNGFYEISVTDDINNYGDEASECSGSPYGVLHDYNDWTHLKLASVSPLFFGQGAGPAQKFESKLQAPKTGVGCAPIPQLPR